MHYYPNNSIRRMGNDCFAADLPSHNFKVNPYTGGSGGSLMSISNRTTPSQTNGKFQFQSRGPIEKMSALESEEIGRQMIVPTVIAPSIEVPELEVSGIRTDTYLSTINTAIQEQEKTRMAQFSMLQQQMRLQAELQQSKIIQMQQQQRQLEIKLQKEALLLQHGPAPNIAIQVDIPPVSAQINNRRKQLQMMKYQGEAKGVMFAPFKFNSTGFVYFGQWNNGQPHGKGLMYFVDGSVFEGGFMDGKPLGRGRLISSNGDYYQGEVFGSSASGRGVSENSLVRYEGMFENNIPHGEGVETSLDGKSKFVGVFEKGSKKQGKLIWGDNQQYIYDGPFSDNLFEGIGVLKSQGGTYSGTFAQGRKHGKGRYEWIDGRAYVGSYIADLKSGYGQLYNQDGSLSYKGQWRQDYPNGTGTTISNGIPTSGQWVNGEFIG